MKKISYDKFDELLKQRNLKAIDVARGIGIYSGKLSDWKAGRYTPKLDKLQQIASFLGVPIECFFDTPSLEKEAASLGIDVDAEKQRIYSLSKDEATMEILKGLESLNSEQKSAILAVIKSFATTNNK